MDLLIVVPSFGQHHYTQALVADLWRENADYLIIDNAGDYPRRLRGEHVLTPGRNLGWAGGSQLGWKFGFDKGYDRVMTLNNDTRISPGFVDAFTDPRLPADTGLLGPLVDRGFPTAQARVPCPAEQYRPQHRYRQVAAVEGVALMITRPCWDAIGGLDVRSFGRFGWGADLDLALRAARRGYGIYTTEMAYINHRVRGTAHTMVTPEKWESGAWAEMAQGMRKRYGPGWPALFPPCSWTWHQQSGPPRYTLHELAAR